MHICRMNPSQHLWGTLWVNKETSDWDIKTKAFPFSSYALIRDIMISSENNVASTTPTTIMRTLKKHISNPNQCWKFLLSYIVTEIMWAIHSWIQCRSIPIYSSYFYHSFSFLFLLVFLHSKPLLVIIRTYRDKSYHVLYVAFIIRQITIPK